MPHTRTPSQARWDAVTVEVSRDQEHEHDRNFRQPRAGSNHMNTHNTKDPVSGRKESFQGYSKDGAVRDGKRGAMRPAEVPTGELCGVGSWASGSGRDRDGRGQRGQKRAVKVEPSAEELERLAKEQEIEREANAKEEREKLKEARKVTCAAGTTGAWLVRDDNFRASIGVQLLRKMLKPQQVSTFDSTSPASRCRFAVSGT